MEYEGFYDPGHARLAGMYWAAAQMRSKPAEAPEISLKPPEALAWEFILYITFGILKKISDNDN